MNFNVISAPAKRLTEEKYLHFKEDYLHSDLNWAELKNKYGLSKKEHSETCKRVRQEENISVRPKPKAKYYYRGGKSFLIIKRIDGRNVTYASFPTSRFNENDMKRIVEVFKEYDWDYDKCRQYSEFVKEWRRR